VTADVHGALWVNDLGRLMPPGEPPFGYAVAEIAEVGPPSRQLAVAAGLSEAEVHERLARGVRAYAIWSRPEGEIASWIWVSVGEEWQGPLRLMSWFADDESYCWEAHTVQAHRGRELFPYLLRVIGRRMAEEGRRWMWCGILDSNVSSQRGCSAAGFRPIVHVRARLDPPPTRLAPLRRVSYADQRLVERARAMFAARREQVAEAS